jgi:DNA-binding beta-propeller fold protein YncE
MRLLQRLIWLAPLCGVINSGHAAGPALLALEATIPMPGVKGRIDHFAIDSKRDRLFVAALGNDTVEVIDLKQNRHERSLAGFGEPQGVLYVPDQDRVYVANGKADRVDILDAATLAVRKRLDAEDADNLRLDRKGGKVIVGYGKDAGKAALRSIDPASEAVFAEIELPGHPESFQLEEAGPRIFVNVPTANQVTVVDRLKHAVVGKWDTAGAAQNFPMALDEKSQRLFVGARRPPVLLVSDTGTGKVVAKLPIGEDTDDIFFDPARKRVYVICGGGRVEIFSQEAPDRYSLAASVPTAPRARTGLFVPGTGRLYVAAPMAGKAPARVLVYRILDQ